MKDYQEIAGRKLGHQIAVETEAANLSRKRPLLLLLRSKCLILGLYYRTLCVKNLTVPFWKCRR